MNSERKRKLEEDAPAVVDPGTIARARAAALAAAKGITVTAQSPPPPPPGIASSANLIPLGGGSVYSEPHAAHTRIYAESRFQDMSSDGAYREGDCWYWLVDVNDLRNRYSVSRRDTQLEIENATGARVETRGRYYPDRSLASVTHPPIHLVISADSRTAVEEAHRHIQQLLERPLVLDNRSASASHFYEEHITIGMEASIGFPLRLKNMYVKHISNHTGARCQLKGRGSAYKEVATGMEADVPLFMHITDRRKESVDAAKRLFEDLLATVRNDYNAWYLSQWGVSAPDPQSFNGQPPPPPSPPEEPDEVPPPPPPPEDDEEEQDEQPPPPPPEDEE